MYLFIWMRLITWNFRLFFPLRCSILFSFVITMKLLTSLICYSNYYYHNHIASIDVFFFFFNCIQKQFCHHQHLSWRAVLNHTGIHSDIIVIPRDDMWNVWNWNWKLKIPKFPKALATPSILPLNYCDSYQIYKIFSFRNVNSLKSPSFLFIVTNDLNSLKIVFNERYK